MVRLKGTNHGFDAVVGNPPYVFGEYHDPRAKRYFHAMFDLAKQQYDTYKLFIERGLDLVSTILEGETHMSSIPVTYSRAMRVLYGR